MKNSILIVDDSQVTIDILKSILEEDYHVFVAENGSTALEIAVEYLPDLILLDILMPEMNGYEVCIALKDNIITRHIPVIFCTTLDNSINEEYGFKVGGSDFVIKPFNSHVLKMRIKTHIELTSVNRRLYSIVDEKTFELQRNQANLVDSLVLISEIRDKNVKNHLDNVSKYTKLLTEKTGFIERKCNLIELASKMHDIGKIGISDSIINKPGILNVNERTEVQKHCLIGAKIIENHTGELFEYTKIITEQHHERWNGKGYPNKLKGTEIDIIARIVAVADVFDALTTDRIYKRTWSFTEAFKYITSNKDLQFDPNIVKEFSKLRKEILDIYNNDL